MANWLERARREIPQSAGRTTANSAERNPTALTAVREPGEPENSWASIGSNGSAPAARFRVIEAANKATVPMTPGEESAIRAWLAHIEETDPAIIAHLLDKCRTDADARSYFIGQAEEVPRPIPFADDRRCEGYVPRATDADQRPGRERWPGLGEKESNDAHA
jgi:hypothetical protein